jgi:hypothetical protein
MLKTNEFLSHFIKKYRNCVIKSNAIGVNNCRTIIYKYLEL